MLTPSLALLCKKTHQKKYIDIDDDIFETCKVHQQQKHRGSLVSSWHIL